MGRRRRLAAARRALGGRLRRALGDRRRVVLQLAAIALLAPLLALAVAEARVGRALERRAYDGWFTLRGSLPRPAEVVVVTIDLDSEASLGRYPWSREWHAKLIRNLHRAGARVVAFDATFADPFPSEDAALRAAAEETGIVVLGAKTEVLYQRGARGFRLEEPAGVLAGLPIGIVDVRAAGIDNVIREYPILHEYPQGAVPQLGVRALMMYLELPDSALRAEKGGWRLGERHLPRGPGGGMLINYLGMPGSVASYSYASVVDDAETDIGEWDLDIFEEFLAEELFRDRIVLVGSTIPEHQDLHSTPFRDAEGAGAILTAGVEIHAHAVATILAQNAIRVLPRAVQYAWTLLLGMIVVVALPRLAALRGALMAAGLGGAALGLAWYLFSAHELWLWSVAPVLAVGLAYAGSAAVLFLAEEHEKARIRGMFQQYVAASVVDELIRRPELLALGGEDRVATVLFSDVVGFSTVSEKLSPKELVELLNEYLTAMTDIVLEHGGIIDKYQGDALMAEFGVPVPLPDHALRACRAALAMKRDLMRLRAVWAAEGKPQLQARTGINTGRMLVGNLGSRRIMDYTVMGDNVNLASRLEGTNKVYGTEILVSEFTWRDVHASVHGRELDRVRVVGKTAPVAVYEVVGLRGDPIAAETLELMHDFEAALALYRERRFSEALEAFLALAERFPEDYATRMYVRRCSGFIDEEPAPEWDGVYEMSSK